MINVFQPSLGKNEIEAFAHTVGTNWIGKGKRVAQFERDWANYIGVPPENVVAITSATEALFQVIPLLGIGPGDEVVMPAISFVGAANAVVAAGARPVFCDVDPRTLNPRGEDVAAMLSQRTKAIIVLHYGGLPADIEGINEAMGEHYRAGRSAYEHEADTFVGRLPRLIEDCACAPASTIRGCAVGTLGWNGVGIWSFDAMKIMSTGDGGMVYLDSRRKAEQLRRSISLGLSVESGLSSDSSRWWEFDLDYPGRKATMNDLTAAVGIEQLSKLSSFVSRRLEIRNRYDKGLAGQEWLRLPPWPSVGNSSSNYAYWIQTAHRDALARYLRERGVYTTFRYYPLNQIPLYGIQPICPNAMQAAEETLWLPCHQGLDDPDVDKVIECVLEFGKGL